MQTVYTHCKLRNTLVKSYQKPTFNQVPGIWLLFIPGLQLILYFQFSVANFKLTFGYMQYSPQTARVRLLSPDFWCLQYRYLFSGSPGSFLRDDRESHTLPGDVRHIRWTAGLTDFSQLTMQEVCLTISSVPAYCRFQLWLKLLMLIHSLPLKTYF